MSSVLDGLKSLAYRTAPAQQANEEISLAREEAGDELSPGVSYELLVDPAMDEAALRARLTGEVLPRLIYFATSRRLSWPACPSMVVSLFVGEQLHFIRGGDFSAHLVQLSGETADALLSRHKA